MKSICILHKESRRSNEPLMAIATVQPHSALPLFYTYYNIYAKNAVGG